MLRKTLYFSAAAGLPGAIARPTAIAIAAAALKALSLKYIASLPCFALISNQGGLTAAPPPAWRAQLRQAADCFFDHKSDITSQQPGRAGRDEELMPQARRKTAILPRRSVAR